MISREERGSYLTREEIIEELGGVVVGFGQGTGKREMERMSAR